MLKPKTTGLTNSFISCFRIKVGATFKCFKYIFMKSENITLRQSFISTTFEYTLNVQFSQKSLARKENL